MAPAESDNVIRPQGFQEPRRFGSGGEGGGAPPSGSRLTMRDYVDARDDAVESRLAAKLDRLPTKGTIWGAVAAIVGSVFTALAIAIGLISFGGDRFDAGMGFSPAIQSMQHNQSKVDARQDAELSVMDDKLDVIIRQTANSANATPDETPARR